MLSDPLDQLMTGRSATDGRAVNEFKGGHGKTVSNVYHPLPRRILRLLTPILNSLAPSEV